MRDVVLRAVLGLTLVALLTATIGLSPHAQITAFAQDVGSDEDPDQATSPTPTSGDVELPTATPAATVMTEADVAARVAPSVVQIITSDGTGSGVRIADGVLTDEHVIHGADRVQVVSADGTHADALVVRADAVSDLALLQTNLPLPALELEGAREQPQGAPVLLMGYPKTAILGTGQATLTRGIVSAIRISDDGTTYVQTDTAMNPGNSGGPLLNLRGHVIGIAEAKLKDTEGINIAVASESIQAFLSEPARPIPVATYNTRKGPRTADQLHQELAAVGYGGPWDVPAMLVAYDHATSPTSTPTPRPLPTATPTPRVLDPALASECFQFSFQVGVQAASSGASMNYGQFVEAIRSGCDQAGYDRGAIGVQCWEFAVRQVMNAAARGVNASSALDPLYRGCLGT